MVIDASESIENYPNALDTQFQSLSAKCAVCVSIFLYITEPRARGVSELSITLCSDRDTLYEFIPQVLPQARNFLLAT